MTAQSAHRLAGGLQLNRRTAGGAIQGVAAGGFFLQPVSGPTRERAQVAEFQLGEGAGVSDEDPDPVRGKLHVGELPVGCAQIDARGGSPWHGHEGQGSLAPDDLSAFNIPHSVVHLPNADRGTQSEGADFRKVRGRWNFEADRVIPLRFGDPAPSILAEFDEPLIPGTLVVTDSNTTGHRETMTCVNARGSNPYRTQVRRKLGLLAQILEHRIRIPANHIRTAESADCEHRDGRGEGYGGTAVGAVVGSGVHRQGALGGFGYSNYGFCRVPTKRKIGGPFPLNRFPVGCSGHSIIP